MTMFKRVLMILLTLAMVISLVPTAFAVDGEITEADTYVLQRAEASGGTNPNMQYESVYSLQWVWDGTAHNTYPGIFTMNSPARAIIPTYCVDIHITAHGGTAYRRLNLEDSTYAASVAGRIRAMLSSGFYVDSSEFAYYASPAEAIAAEVARLGAAANVDDLTLSEAISATQSAIWQVCHGSRLTYNTFARTAVNYSMQPGSVAFADLCKRDLWDGSRYATSISSSKALETNDRICTVFNYLLSLPPVAATSRTVSPASFTDLNDPVFTRNEDGTYNVSVTAKVDVDMASGDTLTLKAALGDYTAMDFLQGGSQALTLTLEGVPAELIDRDVMLSISGYHTASGVFLFDAVGGRGTSQTMVGMDNSRLPVYAEVVAQEERILSITKTTVSGAPLEGIIFDVYKEMSLEEYLSGNRELKDPYTRTDLADYTLITNADGYASLNFTHHGLEDGIYLVVERQHPAIVRPIAPFYVTMPMTNKEGTGYDYEVKVYPKNTVNTNITIDKDVNEVGQDRDSVDAYSNHTWIISTNIPSDFALAKSYVISDTLDNRLDYAGNMVVTVEKADDEAIVATLDAGTDYILDLNDVGSLSESKPSDSFTLSLTKSGMAAVVTAMGTNNYGNYRIRVRFDAQINANAEMGTEIANQATVSYRNSVNVSVSDTSDKPVVYTGAVNLLKVDSENNATVLPGAVFEVYRTATPDEIRESVEGLTSLKGLVGSFVKVSFFDNASLSGPKVDTVTSDADGKVAVYGLAYGEYFLVETQSPPGYNLLGEAKKFTVDATSHLAENVIVVENVSGTVLPETGGMGSHGYVFTGMALMTLSVLLILSKKRRIQA